MRSSSTPFVHLGSLRHWQDASGSSTRLFLTACCCLLPARCIYIYAVVNAVANWDWCTVAAFTCQASCTASGSQSISPTDCYLAAEEVLVVTEAECETAVQAGPPAAGTGPAAGAAESQPDEDETGSDVA